MPESPTPLAPPSRRRRRVGVIVALASAPALLIGTAASAAIAAAPQAAAATTPTLTFTPASLNFGEAPEGETTLQLVTVTNAGTDPVTIGSTSLTGDLSGFAESRDGCSGTTLAAGASCPVVIGFSPMSLGPQSATLEVTPADGTALSVPITGTGEVDNVINLNLNSPTSFIVGGDTGTATVQLLGPSPTGTTVDLTGQGPVASFPAQVVVPAGSSTATFTITTIPVSAESPVALFAVAAGDPDPADDVVELGIAVVPPPVVQPPPPGKKHHH